MTNNLRSVRFSADALGVSEYTVRRLITAGKINAVNIGARLMISSAELDRVISHGAGNKKSTSSPGPNRS